MTAPLTPARLAAIEARAEAATDGPWWAWDRGVGFEIALGTAENVDQYGRPNSRLPEGGEEGTLRREDAEFISHTRTDVTDLVAEVRALRRDLSANEGSEDARLAIAEAEVERLRGEVGRLRPVFLAALEQHDSDATDVLAEAIDALREAGTCPACGRLHFPWCAPYGGEWS